VGFWAPILLVSCRLVQGLALGGEWSGAVLMAVEHAPKNRRAFYGSWPQVGIPFGLVLGTGAFALVQLLPTSDFEAWGWRIPFIISSVLVLVGLYIRLKVEESPAFLAVKKGQSEERFPAGVVFTKAPKGVLLGVLAMAASNIPFYIATVFALKYGQESGMSRQAMLLSVCIAAVLQMVTIPLFATFCDKYGRRPVMMLGCILTALMAFPFFWLIDTGHFFLVLLAMILALPICHTLTFGPLSSFLPEVFPTRLRYSGSGISFTLGTLLFSAPVPFVSAWLLSFVDGPWVLSLYILGGAVVTFIAVGVSRESRDDDIHWEEQPGVKPK
jgi:MFS family permease